MYKNKNNMEILIWILMAYGITNILVRGETFLPLRAHVRRMGIRSKIYNFIDEMLMCMMCTSVWIGFFLGIFVWSPCQHFYKVTPLFSWIFDGGFSTGCVWIITVILSKLQQQSGQ